MMRFLLYYNAKAHFSYKNKMTNKLLKIEHITDGRPHTGNGRHAREYSDGSKEWWHRGKLHRKSGPAVELADGHMEWWLDGNPLSLDRWIKICRSDSFVKIKSEWREAYEKSKDLCNYWGMARSRGSDYLKSVLGSEHWFSDGQYHRIDGPAVIWNEDLCQWWHKGRRLNFEEWIKAVNWNKVILSEEDIIMLKLKYNCNE